MRNCLLLSILALSLFMGSCAKRTVDPPISYLIDTVTNAYLNNDDSLHLPLEVRFLTGSYTEPVSLTIEGLPSNIKMVRDTITGVPTFVADFVLYTTGSIALGSHPVKLVAYSATTGYRTYDFTLRVVHYNCSSYLTGTYSGSNACRTNYIYNATGTAVGDTAINLVNFGGYGLNTTTFLRLNCNTDSVTIVRQNIGNGVTVTGQGHFEANRLVVRYVAENIPTGGNDTCTAILTK